MLRLNALGELRIDVNHVGEEAEGEREDGTEREEIFGPPSPCLVLCRLRVPAAAARAVRLLVLFATRCILGRHRGWLHLTEFEFVTAHHLVACPGCACLLAHAALFLRPKEHKGAYEKCRE